jgi:integrase/recombinase XerD
MDESKRVKRKIKSSDGVEKIVTIGEAYADFIREKTAKGVVPATIRNYELSTRKLKEFGELDDSSNIKSITRDLVIDWINQLQQDGLSTASINHYIRDGRAFLYWCMADEHPYITSFKVQTIKAQETPPKAYTKSDLKKLIKKPTDRDDLAFTEWRNWAAVSLALDMGARAGTLVEIQMGDLNFTNNTLYLRHTKNKKLAHQKLSSGCVKALKEYIELYRKDCSDEEYLLCNVGGDQLTYGALAQSFKRYCKARGLQQYNLHGLRHSFATAFAENSNGDMAKLQKALGHKSIAMAQKYIDMANLDTGDYDKLSPLTSTKDSNKGAPTRKIKSSK